MTSRKNWTLKLAGALLVLVLATSCFVGGTFAKYVTSGSGNDSARVAKFGVTVTANGSTFAETYDTHDEAVAGTIAQSVVSADKVVAPGTSGNMASMTLTGTPEVAVKVSYSATVTLNKWVDAAGKFYCPLTVTVGETAVSGLDYDSAEAFSAAIKEKIDAAGKNYPAGTDLSGKGGDALAISWAWAFTGATGTASNQSDESDTYLGNQAALNNAATIELAVTTTVTQID